MAFQFTYDNDPENVPRDAVRLLIGDTDLEDPLLSDAEVAFYLAESNSNRYKAAMEACRAIAAKLSRRPDFTAGRITVSNRDRAQAFLKLAEEIRKKHQLTTVRPFAGGISQADKSARERDTDRVEPFFTREMFKPDEVLNSESG